MQDIYSYEYWIERIKKEFEGKDIYYCPTSGIGGTRINFNPFDISFCHEADLGSKQPYEVGHISDIANFNLAVYYKAVYEALCNFQREEYPCRECSKCIHDVYHFEKISFVTVCPSMECNSRCIYCTSHTNMCRNKLDSCSYNPVNLIEPFWENELISEECLFDWGGGEPTIGMHFGETVSYLSKNGLKQRINTNAILFSEETANVLHNHTAVVRISPDSGTREGYYRVKGTDNYNLVWDNIDRYCSLSDDVYIKYNLFNMNSDDEELNAFCNQCVECGVRHVILDAEISSYQRSVNAGPFYFTKKEFDAIHKLEWILKEHDIEVEVSGFSFRSRAEYDHDGELRLPSSYYDNIDHEIVCNGNMIQAFSDVKQIKDLVKDRHIALFGAGHVGELAARCLKREGVEFTLVDNTRNNVDWYDGRIFSGDEYLKLIQDEGNAIIISISAFSPVLMQINESRCNALILWARESVYSDYIQDCAEN